MLLDLSRTRMKLCVRKLWPNLFQKINLEIYGKKYIIVRDKSKVNSQCMDDVTGNENIAELFADKYKVLYNSVCSNNDQLKELLTVNNTDIELLCSHPVDEVHSLIQNHTNCITVPHVHVAIKKLKAAKSDCTDHLVSEHFINGKDRLFTLTSLPLTCMLSHGVSPLSLL